MSDEILKLFLDNLRKSAEYNRRHASISVDRYGAICDVAFALFGAIKRAGFITNPSFSNEINLWLEKAKTK
jgi:hypothetical protein